MQGIFSVAYIFSAIGLLALIKKLHLKAQNMALSIFLVLISFSRLYFYFIDRASEIRYFSDPKKEYILQAIVEYIRSDKTDQQYFIVNDGAYDYNFLHYQEKVKFYTFPKRVAIIDEKAIPEEIVRLKNIGARQVLFYSVFPLAVFPPSATETVWVECEKRNIFPAYRCPITDLRPYGFSIARL